MSMTTEPAKPTRRRTQKEHLRGDTCLNCKAEIETQFCPHCGQENKGADLTLRAVLHEFFAELAYYDSKVWRTVRTLVAHPGRLSSDWSVGVRARFLSPVRLYLTVTFLFFLATTFHPASSLHINGSLQTKNKEDAIAGLATEALSPAAREVAEREEANLHLTPEQDKRYKEALDKAEANYAAITKKGLTGWFPRQIDKLVIASKDDNSAITQRYVSEIPKVLFVVLPLFAVALKLLYWRQHRTFVEHLVFLLHFHSFAFLVLMPINFFTGVGIDVYATLAAAFWIPGYAFVAMLRFYRQPWWLTLLKSWVLGATYLFLAGMGAFLALILLVTSLPDPKPGAGVKAQVSQPELSTPQTKVPAH